MMDKNNNDCTNCANCIPIGECDHICDEGAAPDFVLENYTPAKYFYYRGGLFWKER